MQSVCGMEEIMKYIVNPIYAKELRTRTRTISFIIMLSVFNLVMAVIALFGFEMVFNLSWNSYIDYSRAMFVYMVLVCMETLVVVLLVPAYTAGSIAGEREKQTLDILLTTVMTPKQIIWGKLISAISIVLLLVVSNLPILSVIFTIGGVGFDVIWQFILVSLITAFFVGSIGIMASTIFQKTVRSTVFSLGAVIFLCLITLVIVWVVYYLTNLYFNNVMGGVGQRPSTSWVLLILLLNPVVTIVDMLEMQCGSEEDLKDIVNSIGGLPSAMTDHWFAISMCMQILCSALFLYITVCRLDPEIGKVRHHFHAFRHHRKRK